MKLHLSDYLMKVVLRWQVPVPEAVGTWHGVNSRCGSSQARGTARAAVPRGIHLKQFLKQLLHIKQLLLMFHCEVCFGPVEHEDEFVGFAGPGRGQDRPKAVCRSAAFCYGSCSPWLEAREDLETLPCGYLEPLEAIRLSARLKALEACSSFAALSRMAQS